MSPSIPASQLVNVIPSVLSAGGNPLSLNGVFLTQDVSVPIGTVKSFATLDDVEAWFGASATESLMAAVYFAGFNTATARPGLIYFAQFNGSAVAGYNRGGSQAGVTLSQIQALSGTFTISLNGVSTVSGAINLAAASSFSNAAALIQTGLRAGSPSNTANVTWDSLRSAFVVTSSTTGASSAVGFATVGTLATGLKLTSAAGAVLSAGAIAATPAVVMNAVTAQTQNWATFVTTWEPDLSVKQLFAAWVQTTDERFAYVAWDSDVTPLAGDAPGSFGAIVKAAAMDGVFVIWASDGLKAAFVAGIAASTDFEQPNGRVSYAYRSQAGLTADVTNATYANNLLLNGYNFYGAYATANDEFVSLQNGAIAGAWAWFDAYINQIWLNAAFQLAFMSYLTQANSVPYNAAGYSALRQVAGDVVNAALLNGVIRLGVPLTQSQKAQVNTAAGLNIADTIQNTGWYLLITPASGVVRAARGSPPMTFWYTDGGSIQKIDLASINIQ